MTLTSTDLGTEHLVGKEGARVTNIANARNACIEQALLYLNSIRSSHRNDVLHKPKALEIIHMRVISFGIQ